MSRKLVAKHASLLNELKDRINILTQENSRAEDEMVFRDAHNGTRDVCFTIEKIMHFGLRDLGLLSRTVMWDYAKKVDICIPNGGEIVKTVTKYSRSSIGRGRTLIRLGLNERCLDEYFSSLIWNQKLTGTFYTEISILRNETSSTEFLDLLMELKTLNFDLTLSREFDALEYWTEYYREQNTLREKPVLATQQSNVNSQQTEPNLTSSGNTPSNGATPGAPTEAVNGMTKEQISETKKDNVRLRVAFEKVQIEKQQLQEEVKRYQTEISDLRIELATYKRAVGPLPQDILPKIDDLELNNIRKKAQDESKEDTEWGEASASLSANLNKIQTDLHMLTQSELSFLTTHVPAVDPASLMETDEEPSLPSLLEGTHERDNIEEPFPMEETRTESNASPMST